MSIKDYENANWKFEIGDKVSFRSDLAQGWKGVVTDRYLYYINNRPTNRYKLITNTDVHESEICK